MHKDLIIQDERGCSLAITLFYALLRYRATFFQGRGEIHSVHLMQTPASVIKISIKINIRFRNNLNFACISEHYILSVQPPCLSKILNSY